MTTHDAHESAILSAAKVHAAQYQRCKKVVADGHFPCETPSIKCGCYATAKNIVEAYLREVG